MATTVQLNTRIEPSLKAGGDAVLARNGVNPSDAVRSLWRYLSETQALPSFLARGKGVPSDGELGEKGFGLALAAGLGDGAAGCGMGTGARDAKACGAEPSWDELWDEMYDAMLDEYDQAMNKARGGSL